MEFIGVFILVVGALVARAKTRETAREPETLCMGCIHAHIVRDCRLRNRLVRCTFGGVPQNLKFAVADCSMFCTRQPETPVVHVIGFADNEINQPLSPQIAAKARPE